MAENYPQLWRAARTGDEPTVIRALSRILVEKEGRRFISCLDREDAEYCINVLDRGIARGDLKTAAEKQTFFVTLRRLAATHGRLPDSMMITEYIEVEDKVSAHGGFADVRIGKCAGRLVAMKALRTHSLDDMQEIRKRFCKEVILWSTLFHPHVLKLTGIYGDISEGQFITVSEWMKHGNAMAYVRENHVNRLTLLHEAALGLEYMHGIGLAHGDLKGTNVLMSNDSPPRACLCDFGSITMILDLVQPMSCSVLPVGGTITFMAPELVIPSEFGITNSIPTPEADIYAFGMVILQVLTGEVPFRNARQTELGYSVFLGLRPPKPANASAIGFSESLWDFVYRCWDHDAVSRPRVAELVTNLASAAADWRGLMPPSPRVENTVRVSEEPMSDTMQYGPFGQSSTTIPTSPTLQTTSGLTGSVGSPSAICTKPPPEEPPVPIAKLPVGLMVRQPQEPSDDLRKSQRMAQGLSSSPSAFPRVNDRDTIPRLLKGFFLPLLGPSGRAENIVSASPLADHEYGNVNNQHKSSKLFQQSNPIPLSLQEIIAESKRRQDQDIIDRADAMLENIVDVHDRYKLLNILCKMCGRQRVLPESMQVGNPLGENPAEKYCGGQATIFEGKYRNYAVAVKVRRMYQVDDFDKHFSEFCREAVAWRHLRHPNILPLLGVNLERHKLAMISEWMDYGNINGFVEGRAEINRIQLLADVATGLEYMHNLHMVHGDLKGANILVNKSFRACIADFGLSTIVGVGHRAATGFSFFRNASVESLMPFTSGGTPRWTSPELLDPRAFGKSDDRPTKQSDCYALGMVVYEVLCGKYPYWEITNEVLVINAIMSGEKPQKPEAPESLGFTSELWGIADQCWSINVSERPDVRTILSHLNHATCSWGRRQFVQQEGYTQNAP